MFFLLILSKNYLLRTDFCNYFLILFNNIAILQKRAAVSPESKFSFENFVKSAASNLAFLENILSEIKIALAGMFLNLYPKKRLLKNCSQLKIPFRF